MKLIGICGYAQHGKNEVGSILRDEFGFHSFAFADPLRQMAYMLDPIVGIGNDAYGREYPIWLTDVVDEYGWEEAKSWNPNDLDVPEIRRILQVLGTECVRGILDDWMWVKKALETASKHEKSCITDLRFPNEVEALRRKGATIWKVHRPNFDNGVGTGHASEKYIDQIQEDSLILNNGNLEDLKVKVCQLLKQLENEHLTNP